MEKSKLKYFYCIVLLSSLSACHTNGLHDDTTKKSKAIKSYELFGKDTANRIDINDLKQGIWYIHSTNNLTITDTVEYKDNVIVKN